MKLFDWNKRCIKPLFLIALLATMVWTVTGCADFGQFPAPASPAENPEPEKVTATTLIITKDRAILAVHEHLLSLAESYEAKLYLAEFYTVSDNWSAQSEVFKDGSGTWYIVVDMTDRETWEWRADWQQASWFVFKDGKVIPSNRLQANALRIESDLQRLSPKPEKQADL